MDQTTYYQGEYAGPLTQRAMDYDGHLVIGVQISDPAPDGSCFFITLDQHMQVCIIPVLASSISPYEPAEPPPEPECTAADLADTRKNLEWLLKLQIDHGISSIGDLRACALTMSDLADVIELQDRAAGASTCTKEVGSAALADEAKKARANWPKIRQYVSMTDKAEREDGLALMDEDIGIYGGTVWTPDMKVNNYEPEPPMYSRDLICLKCDHNYWTIKQPGCPRPICELDKTEYLDKTSCENFTPDTRDYEGRFPPL